jgi:hypothetical protein
MRMIEPPSVGHGIPNTLIEHIMPCNCDHMEATAREVESRKVAGHLIHIDGCLGRQPDPAIVKAAENYYGDVGRVHEMTAELCGLIRGLTPAELDAFVYDGRNPGARALADWWEAHRAADAAREAREAAEARKRELAASALAKLTAEERAALGK